MLYSENKNIKYLYLKYKKKYLNLKQLGGHIIVNPSILNSITINGLTVSTKENLSHFLFIHNIKYITHIKLSINKIIIYFNKKIKALDKIKQLEEIINLFNDTEDYSEEYECIKLEDEINRKLKITTIINDINSQLSTVKIKFDIITNMEGEVSTYYKYEELIIHSPEQLLLCLYDKGNCVSSILIDSLLNNITIDSKTHEKYEGKNYNKFLRGVIILIGKYIYSDIDTIYSSAISSASAWILINNFNGYYDNPEFTKFIDNRKITKDLLIEYYSLHKSGVKSLNISVNIDDRNIANAQKIVDDFIKSNRTNLDYKL